MRRKLLLVLIAVAAFAASLLATARPADAMKPIYGCDSLLQWPCPGPVLW